MRHRTFLVAESPKAREYDVAMEDTLAAIIDYSQWADDRLLLAVSLLTDDQYCRPLNDGLGSVQAVVAHLAGAANAWRMRFAGHHVTVLFTEEQLPTLDDAKRELAAAYEVIRREAARSAEELAERFAYRNTRGVDVQPPRWAIVRHFANHATYHRGQLASMLRRLNRVPPATDFLVWLQEQPDATIS
jgi:uncharacterized damage-inducible protein DinB